MVLGLLVDGWAHNNLSPESVLTPWHAVLYSGFGATAAVTLSHARSRRQPQDQWFEHVPVGVGLALVGLGIFAAGAAGDLAWHTAIGIEAGLSFLKKRSESRGADSKSSHLCPRRAARSRLSDRCRGAPRRRPHCAGRIDEGGQGRPKAAGAALTARSSAKGQWG